MGKKPGMTTEDRENHYKIKLLKHYFNSYYKNHLPKSESEWSKVLDTININMSKYFNVLEKDANILDAGCGVGYLEQYLIKDGFKNIHAIDISQEQIEIAKKLMNENGINYEGKVKFRNTDIFEELNQTNIKYDIISLIDVLEHFKKYEAFEILELAYTALKKSGTILIRVPNMEDPIHASPNFYLDFTHEIGFTRSSLKQCLLATGFENTEAIFEKPIPYKNLPPLQKKILGFILSVPSDSFTTNIIGSGKKISLK